MPENKEERLMAVFYRFENTTIFSESEINMESTEWFGCTVLLKTPPRANQDQINRILIQQAIVNHCGVNVDVKNILQYDPDYMVWGNSAEQANQILRTPEIVIGGYRIVTYPWTPQHGTTILPFDGLPPPTPTLTPAKRPRGQEVMEHLKVTVRGLPPHMLISCTIPKVFANKCPYFRAKYLMENLTATFKTYTSRESIPLTWNVAIRRGSKLFMWPIWMDVEGYTPGPDSAIWQQQNAMIHYPVRYTLFPKDGAETSGQAGGGGQEGGGGQASGGGQADGGGQQGALLLLGYTIQSPAPSSGDSGDPIALDTPPESPLDEEDLFASPRALSKPSTWDQIIEVPETPESYRG